MLLQAGVPSGRNVMMVVAADPEMRKSRVLWGGEAFSWLVTGFSLRNCKTIRGEGLLLNCRPQFICLEE
jgi:hypothetical protein